VDTTNVCVGFVHLTVVNHSINRVEVQPTKVLRRPSSVNLVICSLANIEEVDEAPTVTDIPQVTNANPSSLICLGQVFVRLGHPQRIALPVGQEQLDIRLLWTFSAAG
jgi:hypothetical protein